METTNGFRDEYFFLSNFYPAPTQVEIVGVEGIFQTGEHLFQCWKVAAIKQGNNPTEWVHKFLNAPTPSKAKYVGRSIPINIPQWDSFSLIAMKKTIYAKFEQHPELKQQLLDTAGMKLVEYNDWGDKTWGVDQNTKVGKNQLGELLMKLREYYLTN